MGRSRANFKQADVTRAVKAARAAGFDVARIEIERDGRIALLNRSDAARMPENEYDRWKANRDAHSA